MRASCSQARWARPRAVRAMSSENAVISTTVVRMMMIWMFESWTAKPPVSLSVKPPVMIGGRGLTRAPWTIWTRFWRTIDMPIAVISGASRNEPRSGR